MGQRFRASVRTRWSSRRSSRRKFSAHARSTSAASCSTPNLPNGTPENTTAAAERKIPGSARPESVDRKPEEPTDNETRFVTQSTVGGPVGKCQWVDMPEVAKRGLARNLTPEQRSLLEARFEIITTEASFNKSLSVLVETFYKAALFDTSDPNSLITPLDKAHLFSNIQDIHATSTGLLLDLEDLFEADPTMKSICDVLFDYSEKKLTYYITYVRNQSYQVKTLEKIRSQPKLAEELQRLQRLPVCNGLDLNSFLILPMQRVVRLRLLVAAVLKYTPKSSQAYHSGLLALASLENLISECNAQTGYMEKKERLLTLSNQLEFQSTMRAVAMENRELVKEGEMNLLLTPSATQGSTRRRLSDVMRFKPTKVHLFLFTDLLLITRPKGEKFYVLEVCPLEKIKASVERPLPDINDLRSKHQSISSTTDGVGVEGDNQHQHHLRSKFERLSMRSRHSVVITPRKVSEPATVPNIDANTGQDSQEFPLCLTVEMPDGTKKNYHLVADSLNRRERWLDLLRLNYKGASQESAGTPKVYRQVIATTSHGPAEGDEIDVREGDIMTVLVDLSDGWYKCALTDGRAGWVPKKICSELDDPTARQLHLSSFALSREASRAYSEMKRQDHGTVFQRLLAFFETDL